MSPLLSRRGSLLVQPVLRRAHLLDSSPAAPADGQVATFSSVSGLWVPGNPVATAGKKLGETLLPSAVAVSGTTYTAVTGWSSLVIAPTAVAYDLYVFALIAVAPTGTAASGSTCACRLQIWDESNVVTVYLLNQFTVPAIGQGGNLISVAAVSQVAAHPSTSKTFTAMSALGNATTTGSLQVAVGAKTGMRALAAA